MHSNWCTSLWRQSNHLRLLQLVRFSLSKSSGYLNILNDQVITSVDFPDQINTFLDNNGGLSSIRNYFHYDLAPQSPDLCIWLSKKKMPWQMCAVISARGGPTTYEWSGCARYSLLFGNNIHRYHTFSICLCVCQCTWDQKCHFIG